MESISENDLKLLLDSEAAAINNPSFIDDDPVRFPRRFEDIRDIEICALLVSAIAWGKRSMILRDAEKMLTLMDHSPYHFVKEQGYHDIPDELNIHRTFFGENLKHFLSGLHVLYDQYDTLDNLCKRSGAAGSEFPAWKLAENINYILAKSNNGNSDSRCLPLNMNQTALKRLNMALRWLVRNDGIVDLGIWRSLTPSQLFIPLDVHVANVSRDLGLLTRKSNDRKAVIELTERLRRVRPDAPVYYDYALFGIGVTGRRNMVETNF
ncbi:MAG: TIGR02757 family protein [Muribaculaceae bacterium]|nr:TIGR02757 family protein [Muribaculaceae bacterium]